MMICMMIMSGFGIHFGLSNNVDDAEVIPNSYANDLCVCYVMCVFSNDKAWNHSTSIPGKFGASMHK